MTIHEEHLVKRVDTIILLVDDIGRSARFYKDVLGLHLKFKSPGWAEFVLGDVHLALHRKSKEMIQKADAIASVGVSVNFEVLDIEAIASSLMSRGCDPIGGIKDYDFGRYFFVTDPDGYIVGFREYKPEYSPQPVMQSS